MRHWFWIALVPLALSACAPVETYYRAGAPVLRLQDDTTSCRVDALKAAPVATKTIQAPPRYIPPRQYCRNGKCFYEPSEWIPGAITTVDVNAKLRQDVTDQCMARKGYTSVEIPLCPAGSTPTTRTTVLPTLTEKTCAVRDGDDGFTLLSLP